MILNVKIFDEILLIDVSGIDEETKEFISKTILECIDIKISKFSITIKDTKNFYKALILLNEHYTLVII